MIIANLNNWGHSLAGHGQVLNLEFIKPWGCPKSEMV